MRVARQSSPDADVVITKETYKGKEINLIKDDEGSAKTAESPFIRQGHFRLMDLPAELRVYIYQFLLPYNMVMQLKPLPNQSLHVQYSATRDQANAEYVPEWRVVITPKGEQGAPVTPAVTSVRNQLVSVGPRRRIIGLRKVPYVPKEPNCIQTQLFLVSKAISQESRAVLYGSNTYEFTVDSNRHLPVSMKSPHIFGPFGEHDKLPLLRNLRSIQIDMCLNDNTHWGVKRQRARLEYFVSVLKDHSDDEHKKSLLQELSVTMSHLHRSVRQARYHPRPPASRRITEEMYMFSLESLTTLRGIKHVDIKGVPQWYAKCLELCIQGKGGEVQETKWPMVQIKRKKKNMWQRGKTAWVTSRQWYQPTLDWKEFAQRNGVEVPTDVDKYWAVRS